MERAYSLRVTERKMFHPASHFYWFISYFIPFCEYFLWFSASSVLQMSEGLERLTGEHPLCWHVRLKSRESAKEYVQLERHEHVKLKPPTFIVLEMDKHRSEVSVMTI